MQILLLFLTILGGMGLSIEAGLLGPLGTEVGELWATFSIFGVGAALTFLLMLFFSPRNSPSFFTLPSWQLLGGVIGRRYWSHLRHYSHHYRADYWYCHDNDWNFGWSSF